MTDEPKRTYIGTIATTGEAIALPLGLDDPDVIRAAIEAAETAKRKETDHLRRLFLDGDKQANGNGLASPDRRRRFAASWRHDIRPRGPGGPGRRHDPRSRR